VILAATSVNTALVGAAAAEVTSLLHLRDILPFLFPLTFTTLQMFQEQMPWQGRHLIVIALET
jgi:hypothetical protein